MRRINYKSDFDFVLKLKECKGENQEAAEVPFPDCDWEAVFYTSTKANSYTASCKGGEYVNCFKDEGGIHLVFNDHRMGVGTLKWEPHFELPNDIYPDSIQDLFSKQQLGIELVNGPGDCPTTAEVAVLLPYIKGEPFTYEDFTPEQIADLKRPATEAAERADKAVRAAEKATQEAVASNKQLAGNVAEAAGAETERVEAETARVTAETQRQSAEDTRKANEVERVKAEGLRDSNEATRESQEAERQSAETGRINAEKARVSAEASRVAAETKRASDFTEAEAQRQSTFESAEAERAQAEATRVSNENIRIGNEQSRVNAEHTRASQETARQDAESARQSNEQSRVTAEGARVEAENARAIEFAGFAATIAAKQDKITTSEDLSLSEENVLSLTDMAKKRLFIDQWNAACGVFGKYDPDNAPDPEHPFYLNELWLTYKEAIPILESWTGFLSGNDFGYESYPCRTCIPIFCGSPAKIKSCDQTLMVNVRMFRATNELNGRLSPISCWVGGSGIFNRARFVRKWLDIVRWFSGNGQNTNEKTFVFDSWGWGGINGSAHPFEYFRFKDTNINVDCRYYPNIGIDSFQYLVNNRYPLTENGANPFTVKVHPDVYAKLTGDTTNAAAAALTEEELAQWQQLLVDAAEKQITFTTT